MQQAYLGSVMIIEGVYQSAVFYEYCEQLHGGKSLKNARNEGHSSLLYHVGAESLEWNLGVRRCWFC